MKDVTNRNRAIQNAVKSLHDGLEKTILELRHRIADAPDPKSSFWEHLVSGIESKTERAGKIIRLAEESFRAALLGIKTLAECYAALGEPTAANQTLSDDFEKLAGCDIKAAADKARLVAVTGPTLPQEPWEAFLKVYPGVTKDLNAICAGNALGPGICAEIEFTPKELMEIENGNLPKV